MLKNHSHGTMEGLEKYKLRLKSLTVLVDKMQNGTLSILELSELEELTRELHERSIILKYKAFEEKVGVTPIVETKEEPVEVVEEKEVVESTGLEFSLFEETEISKEKVEEIIEESIEETIVPEPVMEEPAQEFVEETSEDEEERIEEPEFEESKEEVNLSETVQSDFDGDENFLIRLKSLPSSVSSQFAESKIESLSGAFGLNERLRYIRELFDGSSDLFAEAISSLDSQDSLGDASVKVEELAFKNSWDLEQEAVLEFMSIIKRRYA